jgi:predicted XRE-type DNA-binding protein
MSAENPKQIAIALAGQFKQAGMTQSHISEAIGASQSQISRVLSGKICRHTKLLRRLRNYADMHIKPTKGADVRMNAELMAALSVAWNGTDAHAHALAQVIRSLAKLIQSRPILPDEGP